MTVPQQSFFAGLTPPPRPEVIEAWWRTVEALSAKDGVIDAALGRALDQEQPAFVLELYYYLIDVAKLMGDLQLVWGRLRDAEAPVIADDWAPEATDPSLHIPDIDPRSHVRVYTEVASKAAKAFQKHALPQMYKVVHSPMLMGNTETTDASPVDSLGEIAAMLALVSWYRDFLIQHPMPTADTTRWVIRELHMNIRTRAMRHVLTLAYVLYDLVIGNDLDGGETN